HGLCDELDAVIGTARNAGTRVQETQVVVDLRHRADGRARIVRRRLLLDRDRGREAVDLVYVGLLHDGQELPRIGRERFHVATLTVGGDGVEGERRLAGARQPGDDDESLAGQLELDVLEVVRARPAHRD